jgi:predicted DNA-binding ribbon-helix-helix protein
MPNAPKTPARSVRIDDELWSAVQEQAKKDGVTVTTVIINGLLDYLKNARVASKDVIE